jgi:hypothetical protein
MLKFYDTPYKTEVGNIQPAKQLMIQKKVIMILYYGLVLYPYCIFQFNIEKSFYRNTFN